MQAEEKAVQRLTEWLIAQDGKCFYCEKPMDSVAHPDSPRGYTIDHFYPKCKGNGLMGNKVLAHYHCNKEKGNRDPTEREIRKFNRIVKKIGKRRKRVRKFKLS